MKIRKKIWLLLMLTMGTPLVSILPVQECLGVERPLQDQEPELDLDNGDLIDSEDDDLLEFLDEPMEEPSFLWSLFCVMGSKLAAHCINAQRYMGKLLNRLTSWIAQRRQTIRMTYMKNGRSL